MTPSHHHYSSEVRDLRERRLGQENVREELGGMMIFGPSLDRVVAGGILDLVCVIEAASGK